MRQFCSLNAGGGGLEADWGDGAAHTQPWLFFSPPLSPSISAHTKKKKKSFSNYDVDWRAAAVPSPGSCPSPHRSALTALWWIRNCHPGRLSLVYKSAIPHLSPRALESAPHSSNPHLLLPGTLYKTTPYITTAFSPSSPPPNLSLSLPPASLGWTQSTHLMH